VGKDCDEIENKRRKKKIEKLEKVKNLN